MSNFFAKSNEFKTRYGSLDNDEFVQLIYKNVLGRPGETSGIDFWTTQLDSGAKTRGQVMLGYSDSSENKRVTRGRVDAIITTYALLLRLPTSGEITNWSSLPGTTLVKLIMSLPSYFSRFN